MTPRLRRRLGTWGVRFALLVFLVLALGPIVWGIVTSLLPTTALTQTPPDLSLAGLSLDNYADVLVTRGNLPDALIDSAIVATLTATLSLVIGSAAAYALARLRVPGSNKILLAVLATQMFPGIVIAIPLFIVFSQLRLVDTYLALSMTYLSFTLVVVIWILKGFFESIPPQLERAAAVDGASTFQTFRMVVLPISLPALFAAGVFAFIEAWNEFFFAIILTRVDIKTAPIAIAEFSGQYQTLYGQMLAAAVLASVPVVLLAIVFRRLILRGFVEGAVKG
ncbi:MAG TPA: carbohydrate ABC transporter permease [Candidatus Limnocylindrales bacterium]|nr:carbohydrate ABC transporter permease [Candidatus Limnocylindrales bacterium]